MEGSREKSVLVGRWWIEGLSGLSASAGRVKESCPPNVRTGGK